MDPFVRLGFTTTEGAPGPRADDLVDGGFVRLRLDAPGRVALYANGQGGFRVFCPGCGANVTGPWSKHDRRWDALLRCACGAVTPLAALTYAPPAAFARWAWVLADAGASTLKEPAALALADAVGAFRLVARRVGR